MDFIYICIMIANNRSYKIVYCVPALYMAGGVERVLTLKANYFATYYGYKITFILTEGTGHPLFYPLSKELANDRLLLELARERSLAIRANQDAQAKSSSLTSAAVGASLGAGLGIVLAVVMGAASALRKP